MIQSIYAEVSNGNRVYCGKRVPKYESQPIPLMKSNYLGEFRTKLEKAKARKNLGIGDEYTLTWGNITGHIEDNADLTRFIEQQWQYEYISPYIQQEIHNVKQALDYALYYVSTYEANDEQIQELSQKFDNLEIRVDNLQTSLQNQLDTHQSNITHIEEQIIDINNSIIALNTALTNINVDKNIHDWIQNNLEQSKTIEFLVKEEPVLDKNNEPVLDENDQPVTEVVLEVIEVKISQQNGNILEVKNDGLFVKSYDSDIESINQDISDIKETQQQTTDALGDLKYNTTLPDSTSSPVHEGITVGQLKDKSLSEILDQVLFPADTRDLIQPTLTYTYVDNLVEVNSPVYTPQLDYSAGDAGETIETVNTLTFRGLPYEKEYYDTAGTYTFSGSVSYEAGEYLVNNRGETTDQRVEAGQVTTSYQVKATYPWYAGNSENGVSKQILVPVNEQSGIIDFSLNKHAVVKLPGQSSVIHSFKLDSGLGYLDVDMDGWNQTTEQLNGITYKVYTKIDSYAAILPHRINFTLVI